MHAAFRGPCSKPTLVLLAAILFSGAMAASFLFSQLLTAQMTAGLSSPEFVIRHNHGPELQNITLGLVGGAVYSFLSAFSYWLG